MTKIFKVLIAFLLIGFSGKSQVITIEEATNDFRAFIKVIENTKKDYAHFIPNKYDLGLIIFEKDSATSSIIYRSILLHKEMIPFFDSFLEKMQFVDSILIDSTVFYIAEHKEENILISNSKLDLLNLFYRIYIEDFCRIRKARASGFLVRPNFDPLIVGRYLGTSDILLFPGLYGPPY